MNLRDQVNNPLHGKSLKVILEYLLDKYNWDGLADRFKMNCFHSNPTMSSTLKFLRKMDWAREQVEQFYVEVIEEEKVQMAKMDEVKGGENK